MKAKIFTNLPEESIDIRTKVFMEEQGFVDEFDHIDEEAVHVVLYHGEDSIGTCRIYYSNENESYMIGRIAVRKEHHGKGIGDNILREAESYISQRGCTSAMLFAQVQARRFYEKNGYVATGYEADDEGCPHIMMRKEW